MILSRDVVRLVPWLALFSDIFGDLCGASRSWSFGSSVLVCLALFVVLGCLLGAVILSLVLASGRFASSWLVVLLTLPRHSFMSWYFSCSLSSGDSSLVLHLYGCGARIVLSIIGVVELLVLLSLVVVFFVCALVLVCMYSFLILLLCICSCSFVVLSSSSVVVQSLFGAFFVCVLISFGGLSVGLVVLFALLCFLRIFLLLVVVCLCLWRVRLSLLWALV